MNTEPTFLFCIGATKAGTSWLYRYLVRHPDCHLRSIKELHYFDMLETGKFARSRLGHEKRIAAIEADLAVDEVLGDAGKAKGPLRRQLRDARDWLGVIAQKTAGFEAYRRYLAEGRGERRLVADITPAYALLPVARLRQMAETGEDVRVVYLLRDPLARLWSQARMMAARQVGAGVDLAGRAVAVMERLVARIVAGHTDREDYRGTVGRLRQVFDPSRLLVELQDRLMTVPGIERLCAFLGISVVPADFSRRVHEGAALTLDEGLRERALAALRPQYEFAATLFPDLPDSWRKNMIGVHG